VPLFLLALDENYRASSAAVVTSDPVSASTTVRLRLPLLLFLHLRLVNASPREPLLLKTNSGKLQTQNPNTQIMHSVTFRFLSKQSNYNLPG
jgi:hypothetical protein